MKFAFALAASLALATFSPSSPAQAQSPAQPQAAKVVRYAFNYVSTLQAVVKEKGFLEAALKPYGAKPEFILALGSNKGFEYLRGGSADFTASGGSAALVARANGNPVKIVYVLSHGDIMALVTRPDTGIKTVADLKGKRVAATPGTEPHYFLLRALQTAGLSEKDIKLVPLIHPDGRLALERKDVDAWAGLDPEWTKAEETGAFAFYHAPDTLSGSVLVASDDFLKKNPELIRPVLQAHEEARKWVLAHPEEAAQLLAKGANLTVAQARTANARLDLSHPAVTADDGRKIRAFGDLVKQNGDVRANVDIDKVIGELLAPQYFGELATASR